MRATPEFGRASREDDCLVEDVRNDSSFQQALFQQALFQQALFQQALFQHSVR
jgi:membrane-anchored protein YejM (alkaline phosphatase superfamily)